MLASMEAGGEGEEEPSIESWSSSLESLLLWCWPLPPRRGLMALFEWWRCLLYGEEAGVVKLWWLELAKLSKLFCDALLSGEEVLGGPMPAGGDWLSLPLLLPCPLLVPLPVVWACPPPLRAWMWAWSWACKSGWRPPSPAIPGRPGKLDRLGKPDRPNCDCISVCMWAAASAWRSSAWWTCISWSISPPSCVAQKKKKKKFRWEFYFSRENDVRKENKHRLSFLQEER